MKWATAGIVCWDKIYVPSAVPAMRVWCTLQWIFRQSVMTESWFNFSILPRARKLVGSNKTQCLRTVKNMFDKFDDLYHLKLSNSEFRGWKRLTSDGRPSSRGIFSSMQVINLLWKTIIGWHSLYSNTDTDTQKHSTDTDTHVYLQAGPWVLVYWIPYHPSHLECLGDRVDPANRKIEFSTKVDRSTSITITANSNIILSAVRKAQIGLFAMFITDPTIHQYLV